MVAGGALRPWDEGRVGTLGSDGAFTAAPADGVRRYVGGTAEDGIGSLAAAMAAELGVRQDVRTHQE